MLFRLAHPMKRPSSANAYCIKRIPEDVKAATAGLRLRIPLGDGSFVDKTIRPGAQDVRLSLRTSDPIEANRRQTVVLAHLETVWQGLRAAKASGPVRLLQEQIAALAGELYGTFMRAFEREPGTPDRWQRIRAEIEEAIRYRVPLEEGLPLSEVIDLERAQAMEQVFGQSADELLAAKALIVDASTRLRLLEAIARVKKDVALVLERRAEGDYAPDPGASRFPEWRPPVALKEASLPEKGKPGAERLTFDSLVDRWWNEGRLTGSAKPSTEMNYRAAMRNLSKFLKHDDPSGVTPDDIIRYKDHRLASGISGQTVKGGDLVAFKTVFGYGVTNQLLANNPAKGLTFKTGKRARVRDPGFDAKETLAILRKSLNHKRGTQEGEAMAWAKRWVPWLCAFTGARVGEMIQLRKKDVYEKDGHWVLRITPDAGTVKTNEFREVPLHRQLVALGFLEWVRRRQDGSLFLSGDSYGQLRTTRNRLADFVREVVPDPNVQPMHAFRHRFKTLGLELGIEGRILDAIQGHAPSTAGEGYGMVTIKAKAAAIEKLPDIPCGVVETSHTSAPCPAHRGHFSG